MNKITAHVIAVACLLLVAAAPIAVTVLLPSGTDSLVICRTSSRILLATLLVERYASILYTLEGTGRTQVSSRRKALQ